jgi:putative ABC transport system permease protein
MLRNYLVIALRNLRKQKGYTFINVAGLTVALAVCIVIGLFARHELSYDRFHPGADRLYRVVQHSQEAYPGFGADGMAITPPGLAQAVQSRFPEIEHATVVGTTSDRNLFTRGNEQHFIENVFRADDAFFEVFPFELVRGDPREVLAQPGQMVITRSLARKLFGAADPIGQVLSYENEADYTVAGVVEDVPSNAHFQFEALLSLSAYGRNERYGSEVSWNFNGGYLYVRLKPSTDTVALQEKLRAFEESAEPGGSLLALQPVTSIHLHSNLGGEIAPQSDIRYLYVFSAIGLIIMVVACVNYMNLATARSTLRVREIGVRKVVGAQPGQLRGQFLSEAVLMVLLALPFAFVLVELTLTFVNRITGQELRLSFIADAPGLLLAFGVLLLVGVGSGLYPAFFLSRFNALHVLRGGDTGRRGGPVLRRILVVFQFAASVALIIGTIVVQQQLEFVQNRNLGFDEERVVTFTSNYLGEHYDAFKQALLANPAVVSVTSGVPMGVGQKNMATPIEDEATGESQWLSAMYVDYDYVETLDLRLREGRSFDPAFSADTDRSVILTVSAARLLGVVDDPIGKTVTFARQERTVIGLVEDVHNAPLHHEVEALAFWLRSGPNWTGLVRLAPDHVDAGLSLLDRTWRRFVPDRPFTFEFLDDQIEAQYRAEQRLSSIFGIFAGLTVFVSCLGLFGLAAFTAERRTKEIGIRKVLGASVSNIVTLLSKDFVRLVLIAVVIAAPLAYFGMQRWLDDFAYRIQIGPGIFLVAGALALLIAVLTVSYQSVKAALADPVKSLRYE